MKANRVLTANALLGLFIAGLAAAALAAPAGGIAGPAEARQPAGATPQPVLVAGANPVYPEAERKAGVEGSVLLACEVGADGTVTKLAAEQEVPGHPAFTEAALAAVRQWRFEPAREGGKAVACAVKIPVRFKLDDDGKGARK